MRVLKFGGSSVATADRIRDVNNIILEAVKDEPIIVVVSAFYGVSNQLLTCAQMAANADAGYMKLQQELVQRHHEIIKQLIPKKNEAITVTTNHLLDELNEILQGIFLLKELTLGAIDNILSFGERLSANILAAYINQQYPAQFVDARTFIFTDNQHTAANVLLEDTDTAINQYYDKHFANHPIVPIVTGFIGSTIEGRTTTLGRNSSDYTATIIGAALGASRIEIWTDVDGVYSADPNLVPTAFIVPTLSYLEAIELSYFGGKVMHALTFKPVIEKDIPILIKNTLNPDSQGTFIVSKQHSIASKKWMAKSVTAVDEVALIIMKSTGITSVSHMKERLFRSLSLLNIQTFLHLEGSPKNNIHIVIKQNELEKALDTIQREFRLEFEHQLITIEEKTAQSIIAIIGDEMKKLPPETAGKMFQYLGRMGIPINAIVYGASERNICIITDDTQRVRALNFIHQAFFSGHKSLAVLMIGAGRVGNELLKQLSQQRLSILEKKIDLTICAISNSKKMITDLNGIDLEKSKDTLLSSSEPFSVTEFLKIVPNINSSNIALIDCTASQEIVEAYPLFIQEGVHIITPNKKANVLPYPQYKSLMSQFKRHHSQFLCRANVGAGLPVLSILKDLLNCGDEIIKIEGIFSGTLSYTFNHYDGKIPFGRVLEKAHQLQLTEPDPREDLSGIDVGRKLLIMARYMGWKINLSDVFIENLVPKELQDGEFNNRFFEDFQMYEGFLKSKLEQCQREKKVLRYIGSIQVQNHTASAQLEEIPEDHPLALSCYSDNIIAFTTHHYHETPLVIRGPGAGVECTAMGVFSDILELIGHLPD